MIIHRRVGPLFLFQVSLAIRSLFRVSMMDIFLKLNNMRAQGCPDIVGARLSDVWIGMLGLARLITEQLRLVEKVSVRSLGSFTLPPPMLELLS